MHRGLHGIALEEGMGEGEGDASGELEFVQAKLGGGVPLVFWEIAPGCHLELC